MKKLLAFILVMCFLAGCNPFALAEGEASADNDDLPWLEYTVDMSMQGIATGVDNPNDVVTPWIEKSSRSGSRRSCTAHCRPLISNPGWAR